MSTFYFVLVNWRLFELLRCFWKTAPQKKGGCRCRRRHAADVAKQIANCVQQSASDQSQKCSIIITSRNPKRFFYKYCLLLPWSHRPSKIFFCSSFTFEERSSVKRARCKLQVTQSQKIFVLTCCTVGSVFFCIFMHPLSLCFRDWPSIIPCCDWNCQENEFQKWWQGLAKKYPKIIRIWKDLLKKGIASVVVASFYYYITPFVRNVKRSKEM